MANHRTMLETYKGYTVCRITGGLTYATEYAVNNIENNKTIYTGSSLKDAHRFIDRTITCGRVNEDTKE